jgi:hypothetical protein
MVFVKDRCSSVNGVSSNKLAIPMTPFIGVRNSCVIIARNDDFARAAVCAC